MNLSYRHSITADNGISSAVAKKASRGDSLAFEKCYEAIAGKMYSLCLRYAGGVEDANDFFQEGFLKLYRHLPSFRADGSFEGWARRIFVTTCLDCLKKKNNLVMVLPEAFDTPSSDETGLDKLSHDDLLAAIRKLPEGYRIVVNLHLVEGYSHREIGKMLAISEEGSRSQLFRGRALLTKTLLIGKGTL